MEEEAVARCGSEGGSERGGGEGAASAVWNAPLQEWLSAREAREWWWCGGIARLAVRKVQAVDKGFVPELDVSVFELVLPFLPLSSL